MLSQELNSPQSNISPCFSFSSIRFADRELDHVWNVPLKDTLNPLELGKIEGLGIFSRLIAMTAAFYQWHTATSVNRCIPQGDADQSVQRRNFASLLGDDYGLAVTGNEVNTTKPLVSAVHRAQWRRAASEAISTMSSNIAAHQEGSASQLMKLYRHISIVLIIPLQPMCEYIGWMATRQCTAAARQSLCTWLRGDIQGCRRATMHAITLFCLVRRRKSTAHSENHHLFVAFLTIWTFFSLDPVARGAGGNPSDNDEEMPFCCCIEWDGGVDAAVQERWIQAPGHPRIRIAGVGNLDEPSAMYRILVETHQILLSDQVWGIGRLFAGVLEGLIRRGSATGET
jgi:hypothetical protein